MTTEEYRIVEFLSTLLLGLDRNQTITTLNGPSAIITALSKNHWRVRPANIKTDWTVWVGPSGLWLGQQNYAARLYWSFEDNRFLEAK